jgi:DNA-binding SARP family transcriptional activator
LYERTRLQLVFLSILDKLVTYCETHNAFDEGLAYGMRILRYDRASERAHRQIMRLHYLKGDRTAALRQYQQCVATLDEELGVLPSQRTTHLHKQIQADQFVGSNLKTTTEERLPSPSFNLLDYLKQLQVLLTDFQHQVQEEIQRWG